MVSGWGGERSEGRLVSGLTGCLDFATVHGVKEAGAPVDEAAVNCVASGFDDLAGQSWHFLTSITCFFG